MQLGVTQLLIDCSSLFVLNKELPPSPDIVDRLLRVPREQSSCQYERWILMLQITRFF